MISDFLNHSNKHTFETDVCVIGSGAAGLAIAREFLDSRLSVMIVESGGRKWETSTQELYRSEVVGLPHSGIHRRRARIFGGTTTLWPGQTLPLNEMDFEVRAWVADSGWPLSRRDLEPFYRRAERTLHLEPIDYTARQWAASRFPAFDDHLLAAEMSQFSPKPNFAATYRHDLAASKNLQVLLHANAIRLSANAAAGSVRSLAIKSLSGKEATVKARLYVLCCGGIENARLLLASNDVDKNGLGNRHDVVGRYFQDHVQARPARLVLNRPDQGLPFLRLFHSGGVAYSPRVVLSPALQRERRTLHVCIGFPPRQMADEQSPIEAARRVYRRIFKSYASTGMASDLRLMLTGPREICEAVTRRFIKGEPATKRQADVCVELQVECEPTASSRVTLADETDRLGMRRAKLDWRLTPLVKHTAIVAVETVDREFRRLGLGRVDMDSFDLARHNGGWKSGIGDMYHHLGTCRMSSDPLRGVVDANCRVHGVDNLYVGGSATFPIGGYANPTFTIIALAIRLADHLKDRFANGHNS